MKRVHLRTSLLIRMLGKPAITACQAKRLDTLGFNHQSLIQLRKEASDDEGFMKKLKDKGVNSKPLRKKLSLSLVQLVKQEK